MKKEKLTQSRLKESLSYDSNTGVFTWISNNKKSVIGKQAGRVRQNDGYVEIGIDYDKHLAHRLAWLYVYGVWPTKQLDHINRQRADNSILNLRESSQQENMQNVSKHLNTTSKFIGVSWHSEKKKWQAQICFKYKIKALGYFESPEEASEAYKKAKSTLHSFQPTVN